MRKKAWFFKNRTVLGILGVMLVFGMLAAGCPNGNDGPLPPTTYVVTFNTDGGSAVANQTVEEGKTVAKPEDPTKAGNTFANWYRNAEKTVFWNFDTDVVVQDTTIYAKWVAGENVESFKVTFDTDGGSTAPAEQSVLKDEPVQEPSKPTKTGYIFDGWYTGTGENEAKWNFSTGKVTAAITLKAKWIEAVKISFETNGGSAIAPVTVAKGSDVSLYNQPTKAGNVFDGWYKDAEFTTPAGSYLEEVTGNITLYAKWTATSVLADYAGVWNNTQYNNYWLQADGTAWEFYSSSDYFSFYKGTWSTSQISGAPGTFNAEKNQFTTSYSSTYTKNTTETKTPVAATGALLGLWVNGDISIELKANGDAVLTGYSDTITLKYSAETDAVYLLTPTGNLVIISIAIADGKPASLSKPTSDTALAGIWKLTEGDQDYYWTLTADGSGTFHTLGASVPVSFTVTEDKKIDGSIYTVSGNTLTFPDARWDEETQQSVDLALTKVTSVPSGSGADGDSRLHGTWKATQDGETITVTLNSNGVMTQSYDGSSSSMIWKADGSTFYVYNSSFGSSRAYPQTYTVSGSTLTISQDGGYETELTKQ